MSVVAMFDDSNDQIMGRKGGFEDCDVGLRNNLRFLWH